jgi:hypothetical protein
LILQVRQSDSHTMMLSSIQSPGAPYNEYGSISRSYQSAWGSNIENAIIDLRMYTLGAPAIQTRGTKQQHFQLHTCNILLRSSPPWSEYQVKRIQGSSQSGPPSRKRVLKNLDEQSNFLSTQREDIISLAVYLILISSPSTRQCQYHRLRR